MGVSIVTIGSTSVTATTPAIENTPQVVPVTRRVSKRVYRKGRWVTVTTWKHGKRYTKKVWVTGNRWGHKAARKTKNFVMGPERRRP